MQFKHVDKAELRTNEFDRLSIMLREEMETSRNINATGEFAFLGVNEKDSDGKRRIGAFLPNITKEMDEEIEIEDLHKMESGTRASMKVIFSE